jgi:AhpD family alkylhydroperoxidase
MTSPFSYDTLTRDISGQLAVLRGDLPAFMKSFADLSKASLAAGALSEKTKELIALALGVAGHCEGCLGFHAKALVRLGATKAELEEALAVAVYMGGGPSLMYSAHALARHSRSSRADPRPPGGGGRSDSRAAAHADTATC